MIRKVYEVDPMICPQCGGQMKIISFIEEPKVIDRIIRYLKLTFQAEGELWLISDAFGALNGIKGTSRHSQPVLDIFLIVCL